MFRSPRTLAMLLILTIASAFSTASISAKYKAKEPGPKGLNASAEQELRDAGLDKYLGAFTPAASEEVGDGWTKHSFDPDAGSGPICIAGTPWSAFSRAGDPNKLLIFEQGGGACWQDFYFCNILASDQEPPTARIGIWDFDNKDNPFANYSVLYMPYCDGSVFSGDNDVADPNFPFGPVRYHRGLRNQSAGIDLAKALFPDADHITVAGTSAGGVGVAGFAPFLTRMVFGNQVDLSVFNDAGPVAINLSDNDAIIARAGDWQVGQFYPASCTDCDEFGQNTPIIDWRLANDGSIREAFYSTDGDATDRFFLNIPTQELYRELITTEHGKLHAAYPGRYKIFIVSGDDSHTALQFPLFYSQQVEGIPLNEWTEAFIKTPRRSIWAQLIQDFITLP